MNKDIYIALGSNLGDRAGNLLRALQLLPAWGVHIKKVSDFLETKAYGVTDQPDFLNAVARVETRLEPEQLLQVLLQVEKVMGRVRKRHWGERNIDLDLLLYGSLVYQSKTLTLPHPDMLNREFVLAPLAQLAPDLVHPVAGKTIQELWEGLERQTVVEVDKNK
jgi:dihydroneopterin aldolase/2-amino-4-hydroxy-6-hydroxymethyldihydropteridine diphosphokinase